MTAAWRRFDITSIAFHQWLHLASELSRHDIDLRAVVASDDENLEIARDFGWDTVEIDNRRGLGRRFNAAFQHAAREGADYFIYIGSDDWVHPDLILPLPDADTIRTGRRISFVNVSTGRLQVSIVNGTWGVIPWIIPAKLLRRGNYEPIQPDRERLIDRALASTLRRRGVRHRWDFQDPHDLCRVDFKVRDNLNGYEHIVKRTAQDMPERDAAPLLEQYYPPDLVRQVQRLQET